MSRLLLEYRDATERYSDAVRRLTDLVGVEMNSDVQLVRRIYRKAREGCERARVALTRHQVSHGCSPLEIGKRRARPRGGAEAKQSRKDRLTEREIEVLELSWEGLSAPGIAERLGISRKTVDYHRNEIYKKLGTPNIVGAVRKALHEGLLEG